MQRAKFSPLFFHYDLCFFSAFTENNVCPHCGISTDKYATDAHTGTVFRVPRCSWELHSFLSAKYDSNARKTPALQDEKDGTFPMFSAHCCTLK